MSRPFKNKIILSFELKGYDIPESLAVVIKNHCVENRILPSTNTHRELTYGGHTVRDKQLISLEFENFKTLINFMRDPAVYLNLISIDNSDI